jgi:single-strand DNA-binding protein
MANYNRVILVGRLTRDPELRSTPSGVAVTDLPLAVSETVGRGDTRKEEVVYVDITVWDRQAENCCKYLSKGSPILVEGRLKMDQWEDRETGKKRSAIRVRADRVQFLSSGGGRDEGGSRGGSRGSSQRDDDDYGSSRKPARQEDDFDDDFGGDDDIPF